MGLVTHAPMPDSEAERYVTRAEAAKAANAARQERFRQRNALAMSAADRLVDALMAATDRAGQAWFLDNLPEDRAERAEEIIRRLDGSAKVVAFKGRA